MLITGCARVGACKSMNPFVAWMLLREQTELGEQAERACTTVPALWAGVDDAWAEFEMRRGRRGDAQCSWGCGARVARRGAKTMHVGGALCSPGGDCSLVAWHRGWRSGSTAMSLSRYHSPSVTRFPALCPGHGHSRHSVTLLIPRRANSIP